MKKLVFVLSIVCIVLVAAGCASPGSALEQNRWSLASYGAEDSLAQILPGTEITASFDKSQGEVSGSGGCNTYFATYVIDGDNLSISNLAWTERGCISPQGIMEQEQKFLSLLSEAESFQADDTSLTITCSNGKQLHCMKRLIRKP